MGVAGGIGIYWTIHYLAGPAWGFPAKKHLIITALEVIP
tara:strand:- start:715 stop:831 length:117 start_codon:yes stop_codon:yes gene_type:complete